MKSSKPPALATWLVEHMIPGDNNEALAGDLLEQFREGRSVAWYWRQVFVAILVGCSKEFQILWTAIGVTLIWDSALSQFYGPVWAFEQHRAFAIWAMRHGWAQAQSMAFMIWSPVAFNALPVVLTVGMYLGLTRTFSLRRFLRGLSAGLLTMALCRYCDGFLPLQYLRWLVWHYRSFTTHLFESLPVFPGLLVSMWAARPNSAERRNMRSALT
jgi:hypothetical protein